MHDPKKRLTHSEAVRLLSREDLEHQLMQVASSLAGDSGAGTSGEEESGPCWIEPRHLIRIVAPFISMN